MKINDDYEDSKEFTIDYPTIDSILTKTEINASPNVGYDK